MIKKFSPDFASQGQIPFDAFSWLISQTTGETSDEIGEIIVLPNHYYIFLNPDDKANISENEESLNEELVRHINSIRSQDHKAFFTEDPAVTICEDVRIEKGTIECFASVNKVENEDLKYFHEAEFQQKQVAYSSIVGAVQAAIQRHTDYIGDKAITPNEFFLTLTAVERNKRRQYEHILIESLTNDALNECRKYDPSKPDSDMIVTVKESPDLEKPFKVECYSSKNKQTRMQENADSPSEKHAPDEKPLLNEQTMTINISEHIINQTAEKKSDVKDKKTSDEPLITERTSVIPIVEQVENKATPLPVYLVCGEKKFPVEQGETSIGRSQKCDIILSSEDKRISRLHAVIIRKGDNLTMIPKGQNRTLLNGNETVIDSSVPLQKGDKITIEEYNLEII